MSKKKSTGKIGHLVKAKSVGLSSLSENEAAVAEHLATMLRDPDPSAFLKAVADIAKARGMSKIATDTGMSRESLYKAFAAGAKPRHETVSKVLKSLGMQLTISTRSE